jgi:hypothetical protein
MSALKIFADSLLPLLNENFDINCSKKEYDAIVDVLIKKQKKVKKPIKKVQKVKLTKTGRVKKLHRPRQPGHPLYGKANLYVRWGQELKKQMMAEAKANGEEFKSVPRDLKAKLYKEFKNDPVAVADFKKKHADTLILSSSDSDTEQKTKPKLNRQKTKKRKISPEKKTEKKLDLSLLIVSDSDSDSDPDSESDDEPMKFSLFDN